MVEEKFLSYNAMDKLMRKAGALRVSDDAKEALAIALEKKALDIAVVAKKMAEHAGRRTVTKKDIELALNQ
jgi:histone H3/H4